MALKRYQETFGSVQPDGDVFVLAGASVEVRDESSGALASIFEDRAGATPKANPFTTDSVGYGFFYAANGRYRITATLGGETVDLRDVGVGFVDFGDGTVSTLTGSQTLETALDDRSVNITSNLTVNIPTDYSTLQAAIDDLSTRTVKQGAIIDLLIETGHQPTAGVLVEDGDFSHFQISSVDAEVTLAAGFPAVDIIKGANAAMPVLNCLINANSLGVNGYFADQGSSGFVTSGSGIKFCNEQACYANAGSQISADNTIWTNSSQAAAAYSGILAWASLISAQGADVSNSNYYGAQAAAGGVLNFRDGIADGAARHGVRATNMGVVNARNASSKNTGVTGFRAFDSGIIHATGSNASGSLGNAYQAENNGVITCDSATADAVTSVIAALQGGKVSAISLTSTSGSVRADNGSEVTLVTPSITAPGARALNAAFGSKITVNGGSVSGGDGDRCINIVDGSEIVCTGTSLTASSTETYLAVVDNGSSLHIYGGTHNFPNSSVNLVDGSLLRLHGSGILAGSVPGMSNATLVGRGIMWGAS